VATLDGFLVSREVLDGSILIIRNTSDTTTRYSTCDSIEVGQDLPLGTHIGMKGATSSGVAKDSSALDDNPPGTLHIGLDKAGRKHSDGSGEMGIGSEWISSSTIPVRLTRL
jgi:hypothetical protein